MQFVWLHISFADHFISQLMNKWPSFFEPPQETIVGLFASLSLCPYLSRSVLPVLQKSELCHLFVSIHPPPRIPPTYGLSRQTPRTEKLNPGNFH